MCQSKPDLHLLSAHLIYKDLVHKEGSSTALARVRIPRLREWHSVAVARQTRLVLPECIAGHLSCGWRTRTALLSGFCLSLSLSPSLLSCSPSFSR